MIRTLVPSAFRGLLRGRVQRVLARLIRSSSRQRVLGGPFRGMLVPISRPGMTLRFLLGTYELELHAAIEQLFASGLRTVINCGAGHGFYAVGFALRCPNARVIAFETLTTRQHDIGSAAELNDVGDRVALRGRCDSDTLRDSIASAAPPLLVLADIEGDEATVFDAKMAAQLSEATVLIETHDNLMPRTTDRLLRQFAATHRVEVYTPRGRTRGDLPREVSSAPWSLVSPLLVWLVKEYRGPQRWLLFTPRTLPP